METIALSSLLIGRSLYTYRSLPGSSKLLLLAAIHGVYSIYIHGNNLSLIRDRERSYMSRHVSVDERLAKRREEILGNREDEDAHVYSDMQLTYNQLLLAQDRTATDYSSDGEEDPFWTGVDLSGIPKK